MVRLFYADLRLRRMGVVRGRPGERVRARSDDREVALVWMLDAPAVAEHDGEVFPLEIGTVMLVPQWLEVKYTWSPSAASHQAYIAFECDPLPQRVSTRTLAPTDVIPSLLNHVLWLDANRPDGWRELATRAFDYAYTAFLSGHSTTERHTVYSTSDAVARAVDHVRRVWGDLEHTRPLTLAELAEAARVGRQYLCRVFERDIGVGPVECFRLMQLKRAANYLDQTDLPIADISARVGYTDESSFSRAFKRASGHSPRAHRKNRTLEFELPTGVRRLIFSTLLT